MGILVLVLLAIMMVYVINMFFDWLAHIDSIKNYSDTYGWGNFDIFIKKYKGKKCETGEYNIKVDNKGMLLPFIEYFKYRIWLKEEVKRQIRQNQKERETIQWK